jgi:serine protease Do
MSGSIAVGFFRQILLSWAPEGDGRYYQEMRLTSVRTIPLAILVHGLTVLSSFADTGPNSVKDLRKLEQGVKKVVEKALPATVSLYSKRVGSSGSGVVISAEGLILTAGHVVQGLEFVTVVFPDGEETKGKVLGTNLGRDAAMVQLEEKGPWPFVEVGDSEDLKVGDFVVTLGHAGGFDALRTPPVRFGRVGGTDRRGFLSTDCAVIGGDSGGPLFDLEARVVGINSSIAGELDANNHTGVANFKSDWDRLLAGETWGTLQMNPLADPDRPVMGFLDGGPIGQGVLVGEVVPFSPAASSGLRAGDVIERINGADMKNFGTLLRTMSEFEAGDEVSVEFLRGGDRADLQKTKLRLARMGDVSGE